MPPSSDRDPLGVAGGQRSPEKGIAGEDAQRERHQGLTDRASERHDALTAAIERLERALAEAGVHRERRWSERAAHALENVREMIRLHAEGVEEKAGLFEEILEVAPRLDGRVRALRDEHRSLSSRTAALAERLVYRADLDVVELRREAAGLLGDLRTHRASEADLVYEAFWMELGAVD